ncbi:MAG: hypothetical protein ACYSR4_04995, partial [Planctomycetota bacterium]
RDRADRSADSGEIGALVELCLVLADRKGKRRTSGDYRPRFVRWSAKRDTILQLLGLWSVVRPVSALL